MRNRTEEINVRVFKTEKNGLIFFFFGVLGISLGVFGHHQPFSFDLALVATMFIEVGILWRRHEAIIKKYTLPLLLVACVYWFSHTMRNDYIELWARYYGGYETAVLAALAGNDILLTSFFVKHMGLIPIFLDMFLYP